MRKTAKERKLVKQKALKQTTTNTFINNDSEVASFIKISIIVLLLLVVFTVITNAIINNKGTNTPTTIQYTKIIVGNILSRSETEYYVLVEKKDDPSLTTYDSYLSTYNNKEGHLKVYKVDLSDGFNQIYNDEKSNLDVTDISEIRFSTTTLLYIKEGKIVETYANSEKIESKLKELSA